MPQTQWCLKTHNVFHNKLQHQVSQPNQHQPANHCQAKSSDDHKPEKSLLLCKLHAGGNKHFTLAKMVFAQPHADGF